MTRLLLAFAFVAATSGAAFADEPPTDAGAKPDAAAPAKTPSSQFKNVSPATLEAAKLSGNPPRLPDVVKLKRMGWETSGTYKICVGTDGNVASVMTFASVPDADESVMAQLREWKFKPQPVGICSLMRFAWTIHR